jgi:hypothetical protein
MCELSAVRVLVGRGGGTCITAKQFKYLDGAELVAVTLA